MKKEKDPELSLMNGMADINIKREYINASVNNNNSSVETDRKIKTISDAPAAGAPKSNGNEFSLALQEYPPLARGSAPAPVMNGAPPGFKRRPPCDGMTFTNSAGQTFPAPLHSYIPPPDFEQRNRALVEQFAVALGGAAAVEDFKAASRAFRSGGIGAEQFYAHCAAALGGQLRAVFPELVALLPDIGKQQELAVAVRAAAAACAVCAVCGQLLAPADRAAHDAAHWPPL